MGDIGNAFANVVHSFIHRMSWSAFYIHSGNSLTLWGSQAVSEEFLNFISNI